MSLYVHFIASVVVLFFALRLALGLARRGLARLDRNPGEVLRLLHWPLQLFLLAAAAALTLRLFPALAAEAQLARATRMLVLVAAVWLGIRVLSLIFFRLYFEQVRGVPAPMALQRVTHGALYYASLLAYLHLRYGFRIADLLVTTAVVGILISIPLQSTLGGLIAGIQLSLGDHYRIGDRVRIGDISGVVVESHWSYLQLESDQGDPVTVPLRRLQEVPIVNLSRPGAPRRLTLTIPAPASLSPGRMRKILLAACRSSAGVEDEPPPGVRQSGLDGERAVYELKVSIAEAGDRERVTEQICSTAWYAMARAQREAAQRPVAPPQATPRQIAERLAAVEFFAPLSSEEVAALAERATLETWGEGELLFARGSAGEELAVVVSGSLAIEVEATSANGIRVQERVARIGAGGIVGEISLLTGEPRSAAVVVAEESEIILINRRAFQQILTTNRQVAREMSEIMAARLESDATLRELQATIRVGKGGGESLLSKIRELFDL